MGATLAGSQLKKQNLKKIMDWMKGEKNFLVFVGNPGIGKTYHCAAVYNWLRTSNPTDFVRYFTESHLLGRLRGIIDQGWSYEAEIKHMCDDKWLIIDDIGSTNFTEWRKEVFFQLVDFRYDQGLPTMFTSNLMEQDFLTSMHPRVADRLFARENYIIDPSECINLRKTTLE